MAQKNEQHRIVCRRCGVSDLEHESAWDAIRAGWRFRRVGESLTKDYQWSCVQCAQSERPPAAAGDAVSTRPPPGRPD